MPGGKTQQYPAVSRAPARHVDQVQCLSVSVSQCQSGFHGAINHFFLQTATDGTLRNHLYKILQLEKWNLNLLKSDQDFIFGNPGFYKIKP